MYVTERERDSTPCDHALNCKMCKCSSETAAPEMEKENKRKKEDKKEEQEDEEAEEGEQNEKK